jgi:tight adherence protein B
MAGTLLLIFVSVFFGIVTIFLIVALFRSPSAALKRRIERLEKSEESVIAAVDAKTLLREIGSDREVAAFKLPVLRGILRLLIHSGIGISPLKFVVLTLLASVCCFTILQLLAGRLLVSVFATAAVAIFPFAYLLHLRNKRQQKFEEQLPDTLLMVARSLRAGHSLIAAVELIGNEQPEPTSGLFRGVYEQQQLGIRTADALTTIPDKIDCIDLYFFVAIIRVNSETGGNLAEVLETLSQTIRSRMQLRRQVRTYTAEGRLSGYVLLALPILVFLFFNARNPKYMEPFFTERVCQWSLLAAAIAQVVGFLVIRKIIRIRI